ncbi:MAG: hypothetical protein ABI787_07000 [Spartobacteria bacterium]
MKIPSRHRFTLISIFLVSFISPIGFSGQVPWRQSGTAANFKRSALADLPPDAWVTIADALEREEFSVPQESSEKDLRTVITDALKRDGVLAPEEFIQTAKLTGSDSDGGDNFGFSVAIQGETIVVGAPNVNAAYVFAKSAGAWAQSAKLIPAPGTLSTGLGSAVAIDGDTIVVGASKTFIDGVFFVGTALVFVKPGGGWSGTLTETAQLFASDGVKNDFFGISVSLDGDTIVVGISDDIFGSVTERGSAYIFVKPTGGWSGTLTENAQIAPFNEPGNNLCCHPVAISGDTVVVGVPAPTSGETTYIFTKPSSGWSGFLTESATLHVSDGENDDFGTSVAIENDTVVVGADWDDDFTGSAYVFLKPAGGWSGELTENATLTASDGVANDWLGKSVAISGNTIATGARSNGAPNHQSAYLFSKPAGGWSGSVTEDAKLTASDGASDDVFGDSIAIDGAAVVVGAYLDDIGSFVNQGSAYVFENDSPDISYVINYIYRFASGARQRGTSTLFADGTFQDSTGSGGTWALTQSGKLTLQYLGAPCDASLTGRFKSTSKVSGTLRCTDGSGDTGNWQGTIVQP